MRNRQLIYWKWDERIWMEKELERQLDNFSSRCDFTVYLKFNLLNVPYDDPKLKMLLKKTARYLSEKGNGVILDIDPREEDSFLREYSNRSGSILRFFEGELDERGNATLFANNYQSKDGKRLNYAVQGCWSFVKKNARCFQSGTLATCNVLLREEEGGTCFEVLGGAENKGKSFLIATITDMKTPDVLSSEINVYYEKMLAYFSDLPLCGVANDEWRVFLPLRYEEYESNYYMETIAVSESLRERFLFEYNDDLYANLLYLAYEESGKEEKSHELIAKYTNLLRKIMRESADLFYFNVKKYFGESAFVGVHPTYWGDPYFPYFDVLSNGFDWWEVKRDYAQTDEFCPFPIQLALSRKAKDNVWYNMWYSANSFQFHSYCEEAWRNLKFHGKVHYLGWDCTKERLYAMSTPNSMEKLREMEDEIEEAFSHIHSVPDSAVLFVFGMESYCDWLDQFSSTVITRGTGWGIDLFECVRGVFSAYNCDLIPSSEIDNDSVRFENGKVYYGSQEYQAIVCLAPKRISKKSEILLRNYGKTNTLLVGGEGAEKYEEAKMRFEKIPNCRMLISALSTLKISTHRVADGCEYRDGTLVFTADGKLPSGNYFEKKFTHLGKTYDFKGYDYLIVNVLKNENYYGKGSTLIISEE